MKTQDKINNLIRENIKSAMRDRHSCSSNRLPSLKSYYSAVVKVERAFEALEDIELVRLRAEPDDDRSFDDLAGDCYDVEAQRVNGRDTVPGGERTIIAQRKAFESMIETDGVWMLFAEIKVGGEWEVVDSIGGIVGEPIQALDDSGYGFDLRSAAVDGIREAMRRRCPTCRQVSHN